MHPLVTSMGTNERWSPFDPQTFRKHYQIDTESTILFGIQDIKAFWKTTMHPQARTIFFRAFSKCIPPKDLLFKFRMVASPTCELCGLGPDSLQHFLVMCSPRQVIWSQVLSHFYPHLDFSSEGLYNTISSLNKPYWVRYCKKFIPIISTILWQLWIIYWSHGSDNIHPISTTEVQNLIPRIISLIDRLLHTTSPE